MNNTKITLIVFLLCFFIPHKSSSECGPGALGPYSYSFINPAITNFDSDLAPFFLDFTTLYKSFFQAAEDAQQQDNVNEWYERFCENATKADIEFIVYKSSQFELEDLRAIIGNENASFRSVSSRLSANSFARYLYNHKCREVLDYLIFAKKCEPYVTNSGSAWERKSTDAAAMQALIREAKDRFLRTESHYVNLRYAYQAIRLAHYIKDYDQTLELCDYYLPKIDNDPSLIEYWIMGHKAGALQAKEQRPQAAYLFSRVFEHCPSKRLSAFRSFRINTNEEWEECLLLCRNNHERATLYALRANSSNAHLVEEMENIYAYDPKHHALEMLLVREMQRLEKDLLGEEFNPRKYNNLRHHGLPRPHAGERIIELQTLVRKYEVEGLVEAPTLWKLAEGYLEVLAGNYYFAKKSFSEVQGMSDDEALLEQLQVFQLVLSIIEINSIGDKQERTLANLPRKFDFYREYPDFDKLIRDKVQALYKAQGDDAKAFLMENDVHQLRVNPEVELINELLVICDKTNRNPFERSLVEDDKGKTIKIQLLDAKAALFLSNGQLEAAQEVMKEIPITQWDDFGLYNPFIRRFEDCVNCPMPDSLTTYNRGELIQKMLDKEYEARAETNVDRAAALYFELGEAYYNLTYFGPSWHAADLFRSSTSGARVYRNKGETVFSHMNYPLGNRENFNCDRALFYFDKARTITNNQDLGVSAAYMAAKCERNEFYTSSKKRTFEYFRIIEEQYQGTDLYQKIIAECLDFQAYLLK